MNAVLVRYGAVAEVARCEAVEPLVRRASVVLQTHRGLELGNVLEAARPRGAIGADPSEGARFEIIRMATDVDLAKHSESKRRAAQEFSIWQQRIAEWDLDLQLIELEWTLDESKLILYVLNERGPECTKLALQIAAAGLGAVEVQPVSLEGPVTMPTSGGCGSCGCHEE